MLVIGGGIAALCAALAAREAGAGVCLVEQAPRHGRGGNTRHARNFRVAHDAPTPFSPGRYPAEDFAAELGRAAQDRHDPALARLLAAHSAFLPDWLAGHGVRLDAAGSGGIPVSPRTVFAFGGGMTMLNALYARAARRGVAIHYGVTAERLYLDATGLAAVTLASAWGRREIRPRAAIACSGGYQANAARLRAAWGEAAHRFLLRGVPQAEGGVLFDLLDQGAAETGEAGACHLVAVDARAPAVDGGIATRVLGIPAGIVVDATGRRFHDEAAELGKGRYAVWGRLVARCPGQTAWLVLDAPAEVGLRPPLYPPRRAATIAALAEAIGLDPAVLAAEVAAFNAAIPDPGGATRGLDPAKTRNARPLLAPPFAAFPIRPGITFTSHGLKVDAAARVVMADGRALPNLFAAGTIMAPTVIGTGYLAGAGVSIGAVFGRLAGAAAARVAQG